MIRKSSPMPALLTGGAVALMLLGSGCVVRPQPLRYTRADTNQDQFMQDRYECIQEAQRNAAPYPGATPNCSLISACLGARGYVATADGEFSPPPGMSVACHY